MVYSISVLLMLFRKDPNARLQMPKNARNRWHFGHFEAFSQSMYGEDEGRS